MDTLQDAGPTLRIYVNDHRAAATGGVSLAQRCERSNTSSPLGAELRALVEEIAEDAATLEAVASRLSVTPDPVKRVLAQVGEIVGRLKLNGRLHGYSPLSRLLELEALMAGIDAKRSLWRSLGSLHRSDLEEFDFDELERRASAQHTRLVPFHMDAARTAFGTGR
jgi:hypothetical protein